MKRNIILINFSAAMIWMSMYAYVPTLPAYAASIGANVVMIGVIGGAYGVMQILLRIPLGLISDKTGKDKLLLIIGFVILTISAVMFLCFDSVPAIIFARATAGAAAAWWVVICASYAKYHTEEKQVKAQGVLSAAANIGKVVAALACAVAAQFFGYKATFAVAVVVAVVGLVMMFGLKHPKTQVTKPVPLKEQCKLFKNKELISFSILAILSQILCFAVATTFTEVAAEQIGADSMQLGMLTMTFFLSCGVISLFVGTKVYKKLGGINTMALSFVFGAVSCIPAFYHTNLVSIYIAQILSGVCYGVTQAVLSGFVIRCVQPAQRGTATGIFQSLFGIGIFAGPVIVGNVIHAASFDTAYWMMVVVMAVSAGLCYLLIPKKYNKMT